MTCRKKESHLYFKRSLSTTERTTGFLSTESSKGDSIFVRVCWFPGKGTIHGTQTNCNNRVNFTTLNGVGTFSFFGNETTLDFHHEEGQQMENNVWVGRRVVLKAHTGDQVDKEGVAPFSELRVLADRNPARHQRVHRYKDTDSYRGRKHFKILSVCSNNLTNLKSSEGRTWNLSSTSWTQRGQYIWPGHNHFLIQTKQ